MNNNIENINNVFEYLKTKTSYAHANRYNDEVKLYGINHIYLIGVLYLTESVVIKKRNKETFEIVSEIEILDPKASSELIINLLDSMVHTYN